MADDVKLCKDCRYYKSPETKWDLHTCSHPKNLKLEAVNRVTGEIVSDRTVWSCETLRTTDVLGHCGSNAEWFEPKPEKSPGPVAPSQSKKTLLQHIMHGIVGVLLAVFVIYGLLGVGELATYLMTQKSTFLFSFGLVTGMLDILAVIAMGAFVVNYIVNYMKKELH